MEDKEKDITIRTGTEGAEIINEMLSEKNQSAVDEKDKEEQKELTDEEKHELYIEALKKSKIKYKAIVHNGDKTINKFGSKYKKKRQKKNKATKKSRKANRK